MKLLVINGPNINMLGIREPGIYGTQTFQDLIQLLQETASQLGVEMEQFQSNHEGCIVDKIQQAAKFFVGQFNLHGLSPCCK